MSSLFLLRGPDLGPRCLQVAVGYPVVNVNMGSVSAPMVDLGVIGEQQLDAIERCSIFTQPTKAWLERHRVCSLVTETRRLCSPSDSLVVAGLHLVSAHKDG